MSKRAPGSAVLPVSYSVPGPRRMFIQRTRVKPATRASVVVVVRVDRLGLMKSGRAALLYPSRRNWDDFATQKRRARVDLTRT